MFYDGELDKFVDVALKGRNIAKSMIPPMLCRQGLLQEER